MRPRADASQSSRGILPPRSIVEHSNRVGEHLLRAGYGWCSSEMPVRGAARIPGDVRLRGLFVHVAQAAVENSLPSLRLAGTAGTAVRLSVRPAVVHTYSTYSTYSTYPRRSPMYSKSNAPPPEPLRGHLRAAGILFAVFHIAFVSSVFFPAFMKNLRRCCAM